jgi:hypothetical protein
MGMIDPKDMPEAQALLASMEEILSGHRTDIVLFVLSKIQQEVSKKSYFKREHDK